MLLLIPEPAWIGMEGAGGSHPTVVQGLTGAARFGILPTAVTNLGCGGAPAAARGDGRRRSGVGDLSGLGSTKERVGEVR